MRKKQILICLFIASFFCLLVIGANPQKSNSIMFKFNTDTVEIDIVDQTDYTKALVPYDAIPINSYLVNKGADCYVRFGIELNIKGEVVENGFDYLVGLNNEWILGKDDKYYLDRIFQEEDTLSFFERIEIRDLIDDCEVGDEVSLTITVDAIQSKNFSQTLDTVSPWGETEILHTVRSRTRIGGK